MVNKAYLAEAFKQLELLNEEDYNLSTDPSAIEDAVDFVNADSIMSMNIIDDEATSEEELQDSYEGKVILDCSICHSKLYKNKEDIIIDEEQDLANVGEECPFCYNDDGFRIIGQVAPLDSDVEEEPKIEETEEQETAEIEEPVEGKKEGQVEESFKESNESFNESTDDVMTPDEAKEYWEQHRKNDPVLLGYDDYITWYKDSVENGYIKESIDMSKPSIDARYKKLVNQFAQLSFDLGGDTSDTELQDELNELESLSPDDFYDRYDLSSVFESLSTEDMWVIYIYTVNHFTSTGDPLNHFETADCSVLAGNNFIGDIKKQLCAIYARRLRKGKMPHVSESIENATVTTTEDTMTVIPKEDGGVVIETTPNNCTECDGEMIAPLEPEVEQEIEMNEPETDEDGNVDIPIDDFDEETFDELGESYLKNTYGNVVSYKTESIREKEDKFIIEGLITFDSGNTKKTSFIFEGKDVTKSGRIRLIGENCQISRGKKSFTIAGRVNEGKFISESLNYNYRAKDVNGKSARMYGTVRTKK